MTISQAHPTASQTQSLVNACSPPQCDRTYSYGTVTDPSKDALHGADHLGQDCIPLAT